MSSSSTNKSLDEIRNGERLNEFKIAFKISAVRLIGPLFPLFALADYLVYKEHFLTFLLVRLSVTAYCGVFYFLALETVDLAKMKIRSLLLLCYPSLAITAMMVIAGDFSGVYFVGLNLIASGAICFFPWKDYKEVSAVTATVYLPYLLLPVFMGGTQETLSSFVVNVFFIVGSIVVSFVIRVIYEKLKYNEILLRDKLRQEIENRNVIITEKSAAAVRLSTLSKQFSPQVVQAIEAGELEITRSLKRVHICAIFIDIVNSTERVVRIDKDSLNTALSMFMNDTMSVLLKYDITIDKFLGDGVLAFSNAPLEHNDYVKRVVDAAIEIKAKIIENRNEYIEHWKNELEIRIGVDVGYANVGFYGSKDHFRSYTAIGSVVNLASRLCSISNPNTILVSNEVFKIIKEEESYKIVDLGMRKIKGFESDIIKVYTVESSKEAVSSNIPYCPQGHGILNLEVSDSGIYEFKCRSCGHTLVEVEQAKKKAS